jgi:hypothetical protein
VPGSDLVNILNGEKTEAELERGMVDKTVDLSVSAVELAKEEASDHKPKRPMSEYTKRKHLCVGVAGIFWWVCGACVFVCVCARARACVCVYVCVYSLACITRM